MSRIVKCEDGRIVKCEDGRILICPPPAPCTCPCGTWPGAYPWAVESCGGLVSEYEMTMVEPITLTITYESYTSVFSWDASNVAARARSSRSCTWGSGQQAGYTRQYNNGYLEVENLYTEGLIALVSARTIFCTYEAGCCWVADMGQGDDMLEIPELFKFDGNTPVGDYTGLGDIGCWMSLVVGENCERLQLTGKITVTEVAP